MRVMRLAQECNNNSQSSNFGLLGPETVLTVHLNNQPPYLSVSCHRNAEYILH